MYRKQEKGWSRDGGFVKEDSKFILELTGMAID